jgi:hypothetical protein
VEGRGVRAGAAEGRIAPRIEDQDGIPVAFTVPKSSPPQPLSGIEREKDFFLFFSRRRRR